MPSSLFRPLPPPGPDPNAPPKKKRASRPKARTGCLSCKRRHVRCDERKPACLRCEEAEVECKGYPSLEDLKPKKSVALPSRALLPQKTYSSSRSGTSSPPIPVTPFYSNIFRGVDATYFDLFRLNIVPDLSGPTLSSHFWSVSVVRESTEDECIRNSLLAIGALARGLYLGEGALPGDSNIPITVLVSNLRTIRNEHHKRALQYHSKAMSMFRERIAYQGSGVPAKTILMATLLFTTYELLLGNTGAADDLASAGFQAAQKKLGRAWMEDGHMRQQLREEGSEEAMSLLPKLLVANSGVPFCRQYRERTVTPSQWPIDTETRIPTPADSTEEVKERWSAFLNEVMTFIGRYYWMTTHGEPFNKSAAKIQQAEFVENLRAWRLYFDGLGRRVEGVLAAGFRTPATLSLLSGVQLTRIHTNVCGVLMHSCLDPTSLSFDACHGDFVDMVDMVDDFLHNHIINPGIRFTFNHGIVAVINFVITNCRDTSLRWRALELYRRVTWRDGVRDPLVHLIADRALIELEAEGEDVNGFIPARSRYLWSAASWDLDRRKLVSEYTCLVPNEYGKHVVVRRELDIDGNSRELF